MTWISDDERTGLRQRLTAHLDTCKHPTGMGELFEVPLDTYYAMTFLLGDLFDSLPPETQLGGPTSTTFVGHYLSLPVFLQDEG